MISPTHISFKPSILKKEDSTSKLVVITEENGNIVRFVALN